MKKKYFTRQGFYRWWYNLFHPLKDLPVPDFNKQYDPTIL